MLNNKEIKELAFKHNYSSDHACYGFIDGYKKAKSQESEQLRFLIDKFQTPKGNQLIDLLMAEKERKDKNIR